MTTSIASPSDAADNDSDALPPARPAWRKAVVWPLAAGGLALGWLGEWAGLAGGLLVAAALWLHHRQGGVAPGSPAAAATRRGGGSEIAGRHGAEVMVSQVVPVWSRQMDVTREVATDGLAQILQTFSEISGALHGMISELTNFSLAAAPGAIDGAVSQPSPALDALRSASERAFAQRDQAVAALADCGEALTRLTQLAKQAREVARHTRLVAFNASIEANRGQNQSDQGGQAVAAEVRMLATRMAETAEQMERVVLGMNTAVQQARRRGEAEDTSAEELRLEIDLRAREALAALIGSMGGSMQGTGDLQQTAAMVNDQLEQAFMHFQFGDRVSQMLAIVSNDMSNFARWVAANPRATQTDAAEWLAALEASYTMDEQRSHHHGNVHIERSSEVEFF